MCSVRKGAFVLPGNLIEQPITAAVLGTPKSRLRKTVFVWLRVPEGAGTRRIAFHLHTGSRGKRGREERLCHLKPVPADALPLETSAFWRFQNSPNNSIWGHLQTNLIPTNTAGEAWRQEAVAAGHIARAISK